MLPAVKLNNKATLNAHKIRDEHTDGLLPSELVTSQPPIT
jgi:hypothetical protein